MKYTYFPIARLAISYSAMEFNVQFGRDDCVIAEPNSLLKASRAESESIFCWILLNITYAMPDYFNIIDLDFNDSNAFI
jgi:hypothetical protein